MKMFLYVKTKNLTYGKIGFIAPNQELKNNFLYHFSLLVASILLFSSFLGEGLGVRVINHLCHYF
ncbi:hypothetical protein VL20_3160 [Microcystis panniformis FACHB-1757]|uniref:Uncharacterized protein n=1 Tax=Microcystis panniformis FACHB-1757 TaxID=1638788 RepID=A0A0K1S298_9CHRO|nr:hypothetical protein VL20_3160 [Microcystis panniformis FACHB-1757]